MKAARWAIWTAIGAAVLGVLFALAFMIYAVTSRTVTNDYTARVRLSLNAAALSDGVFVKDGGVYRALDDDSRRKLAFYLTQNPTLPLGGGHDKGETIELLIGEDPLILFPLGDNGDKALAHFTTVGKSYRIALRQSDLWWNLQQCTAAEEPAVMAMRKE